MSSTYGPPRDDAAGGDREPSSAEAGVHGSSQGYRATADGFDRDQAEREARDAIGNARDELQSLLESQKNAAAGQVRAIADALRETEDGLRDKGQNSVAAYVAHVADRIDYWSGRLRQRHIQELGRDLQDLANRQPGLFIAGAVVVGFVATRFLKSTQTSGDRDAPDPTSNRATAGSSAAPLPAGSQSPLSEDDNAASKPGRPDEAPTGDTTRFDHSRF